MQPQSDESRYQFDTNHFHVQHQQAWDLWRRTRVLVTNQLQFTRHADTVVYMQDGRIEEVGTYAELVANGGGFAKLITQTEVQTSYPPETFRLKQTATIIGLNALYAEGCRQAHSHMHKN